MPSLVGAVLFDCNGAVETKTALIRRQADTISCFNVISGVSSAVDALIAPSRRPFR
jgi:hypothetical protein